MRLRRPQTPAADAVRRTKNGHPMIRSGCFARRILAWGLAASGLLVGSALCPAQAQGRLDAHYNVSLGGVPFGKGEWIIDVREDQFSAAARGGTTGLLRLF